MTENIDESKSAEQRIAEIGVNASLKTADKLVAIAILVTGEMNPKALGKMLGLSKTVAYRSVGNVWEHVGESLKNSIIPVDGKLGNFGNHSENQSQIRENETGTVHALNTESTNVDTSNEVRVTPPLPPSTDFQDRIRLEKGVLIVSDDFRDFWTDKLGDPENLNLALIQAAGYIQENSRRPLEAQVSAQLARYARDKLERDNRYNSAKSKTNDELDNRPLSEVWAKMEREGAFNEQVN